jgi:hypothetical protein
LPVIAVQPPVPLESQRVEACCSRLQAARPQVAMEAERLASARALHSQWQLVV